MASLVKASTLLWLSFILVLVVNAAALAVPIFIHSPIIQNLIKPFSTAVFMMEALFFLFPSGMSGYDSKIHQTGSIITVLFIVVFAILDIFLPNKNGGEEQQEQVDQQEDHKPEGGKPSLDNMGNFKIITAIYVVIMWITYMMDGIVNFADAKGDYKTPINPAFHWMFRFGTLQYVYGMFVNNDAPPLWLYLVYMIPQAVLWPISALIAYYAHNGVNSSMASCFHCFCAIFAGALMYMSFRMMYQFQQFFKDEGDTKNKIIQGVAIAIGFLWMIFIEGINSMNNEYY